MSRGAIHQLQSSSVAPAEVVKARPTGSDGGTLSPVRHHAHQQQIVAVFTYAFTDSAVLAPSTATIKSRRIETCKNAQQQPQPQEPANRRQI